MGLFKGSVQIAGNGRDGTDGGGGGDVTLAGDQTFTGRNVFTGNSVLSGINRFTGSSNAFSGSGTSFADGFRVGAVNVSHAERVTRSLGTITLSDFNVNGSTISQIVGAPITENTGPAGNPFGINAFVNYTLDTSIPGLAVRANTRVTALSIGTTDVRAVTGFVSATLTSTTVRVDFDTQANREAFEALGEIGDGPPGDGPQGDLIVTYSIITELLPTGLAVGDIVELHQQFGNTQIGSLIGVHYTITFVAVNSVTFDRALVVGSDTQATFFSPPEDSLDVDTIISVADGMYLGGTFQSNFMEEYREATWTPTTSAQGIANSAATITKLGRLVTLRTFIGGSSSSTGSFSITGFPFTPSGVITGTFQQNSLNTSFPGGGTLISTGSNASLLFGSSQDGNIYNVADLFPTTGAVTYSLTVTYETDD
ncbi:MAG: hypothetical protein K0U41_08460 [Gammaproteobacteria bacterium]|nr:hypothetical protein [Gammaproteobacteria bacterium]